MDVTCACGEPWDTYHLRHEAIYETDVAARFYHGEDDVLAESLRRPRWDGKLTPEIRAAFAREGWQFAGSVLAVLHCPACPANEEANGAQPAAVVRDRKAARAALAEILGDDEDALACELEDLEGLGL